jgi:DNA polymerase
VPVLTTRSLAEGVDRMDWTALQETAAACQACDLCAQRKKSVFGVGDPQAPWMVIGEAPGEEEDQAGEPFVGQSGQLLDNMLKAVGLSRQAKGENEGESGVYIANAIKCRPPGNHNPTAQELATCAPYLARQVALVQPKIILLMGRFAVQSVLQTTEPIGKLRGQVHTYQGVPVVVTYHPAYLLRNPADKAKAWADLVLALKTARG